MPTLDELDDKAAAAAFRRLVRHLRHRSDAQNVDLMGLAGFCRNCLSDWTEEASKASAHPLDKSAARETIYGMPYSEWKTKHQAEASPEQLAKMKESVAKNKSEADLDDALDKTFPASDPPSMTEPGR